MIKHLKNNNQINQNKYLSHNKNPQNMIEGAEFSNKRAIYISNHASPQEVVLIILFCII